MSEEATPKHPGGRPALYTDELALAILTRIVEGESLSAICREESMPSISTVLKWRRQDPEFSKHYDAARVDRTDTHAERMMEIADDGRNDWMEVHGDEGEVVGWKLNSEHVQRSKLRVDTLKWIAGRMNPKVYGDRVQQEVTGKDGGPIQYEDTRDRNLHAIEQLSTRLASPTAGAPAASGEDAPDPEPDAGADS